MQPKCVPHSPGDPEGLIKTLGLHGLIQLYEIEGKNEGTVQILPDEEERMALVILGPEGVTNECAAGEDLWVSGKLSLKESSQKFAWEFVTHLDLEHFLLTELWILNKTAEHRATAGGSALIALTGATHVGLAWGGLPA